MNHFSLHDGELFAEDISLESLARQHGTPLFVYSCATLQRHVRVIREAMAEVPNLACYAVKANSNGALLSLFAREGMGFDIVSGGELARVVHAGADPKKVVFSGVGKSTDEMAQALAAGIKMFNVESEYELDMLDAVARSMNKRAPIALRVNPEVDAKTHPYITTGMRESKFGIDFAQALSLYESCKQRAGIEVIGVDCHIGSQILSLDPFAEALDRVRELVGKLRQQGHDIRVIDVGGGLGVAYNDEDSPAPADYGRLIARKLKDFGAEVVSEPGRVIVANAAVLLTRVVGIKRTPHKTFVVVDAGMNDLIRPALYEAYHHIEAARPRAGGIQPVDIVGPVCESGDFFAKNRPFTPVEARDLLCIRSVGAYGASMSSQYNSRPRAAEVLVSGSKQQVVRERETIEDLLRHERPLDPDMLIA